MTLYDKAGWKFIDGPRLGQPFADIQEAALYWAHTKNDECGPDDENCVNTPDSCMQYPEATFFWYAIGYFSDYIALMMDHLDHCSLLGVEFAQTQVGQFYTKPPVPQQGILPISVYSGLAAAISSFFPPAAVMAGAASILTGILVQQGLKVVE